MSLNESDHYHDLYKIIVIGEPDVGKTNLIFLFTEQPASDTIPTLGHDYFEKIVKIDDKRIKAQLWDTGGQERYHSITTTLYHRCLGALLVFDLSKRSSFDNLNYWVRSIHDYIPEAKVILIGNKSDLSNERRISPEEAEMYAGKNGMKYIETSAYSSDNVEQAFITLITVFSKLNPRVTHLTHSDGHLQVLHNKIFSE